MFLVPGWCRDLCSSSHWPWSTSAVVLSCEDRSCVQGCSMLAWLVRLTPLLPFFFPRLPHSMTETRHPFVFQGLCPERDFKVLHGGFWDRRAYELKHVLDTRCVSDPDPRGDTRDSAWWFHGPSLPLSWSSHQEWNEGASDALRESGWSGSKESFDGGWTSLSTAVCSLRGLPPSRGLRFNPRLPEPHL